MAKKNVYGLTYFIVGLLFGLVIGLYIHFQQKHSNSSEDHYPIIIQSDTSKDFLEKQKENQKKAKPSTQRKAKTKATKTENTTPLSADTLNQNIDSLKNQNHSIDSLKDDSLPTQAFTADTSVIEELDSAIIGSSETAIEDSLNHRNLEIDQEHYTEEIQVAKDELVHVIYVLPQGKKSDFLCKDSKKLDSLLTDNISLNQQDGLYVEFWHSPINYTGYKLSTNTLVLFGFYEYTAIRLKYMPNGFLRLQYHDNQYDLKCSDVFVPLIIKKEIE